MKRHNLLMAAVMGLTAAGWDARADYAAEILADAPLIYYRFEESGGTTAANLGTLGAAADGSYNATGVLLGTDSASLAVGKGVALDGMDGFVGVPALEQPLARFSLEMWLQRTYDWPGLTALYANDGWAEGVLHLNLVSTEADPLLEFAVNGNPAPYPRFAPAWAVGEWHHLVCTYDSESDPPQLRVYLDGVLHSEVPWPQAIPVSFTGGRLGMWSDSRQLEGVIDEFALYPAVLSPDRVAARYNTAFPEVRIAAQPSDQTVLRGESASFRVQATGADLAYQWYRDGEVVAGATESVYSFVAGPADHGARFSVRVSNQLTTEFSVEAVLTVLSEVSILTQPKDQSIGEGYTAVFSVVAQGPNLEYQWIRNGQPIADATRPSYTTGVLTMADDGAVFTVTVSNEISSVTSDPARLTLFPMPDDVYGQTVIADQPLIYYRFDESGGIAAQNLGRLGSAGQGSYAEWGIVYGEPAAFTDLAPAVGLDGSAGSIAVPAVDGALAQLTIEMWLNRGGEQPGLTALLANDLWQSGALHLNLVEASPGPLVEFAVNGNPTSPRFTPPWVPGEWDYMVVTYDASTQPGQLKLYLNGTLQSQAEIAGARTVVWTGGLIGSWTASRQLLGVVDEFAMYDSVLSAARIEARYDAVQRGVAIVSGPQDVAVLQGASATFSVVATGPNRLYQWYENGQAIAGATAAEHTIPAVTTAQNGARFTVEVRNPQGSVTSAEARLTVVGIPETDYPTTVLENAPAVYYRFEETGGTLARNWGSLGDSADGVYAATGIALAQESAGTGLGLAVRFNAGHVEIPDLGLGPLDQLTVELWVNRQADPPDFFALLATHGWTASGLHFNLWTGEGSGPLGEFAVNGNPTPWPRWSAGAVGRWYHWVVTYDVAQEQPGLRVYVNGELVVTSSAVSNPILLEGARIGQWGDARSLNGFLDEIALYPSALTHEQVLRHYAAARVTDPTEEVELESTRVAAGELELSWTVPGFILETTVDPAMPGSWTAVPDGAASPVTVPTQDARRFYRLRKP